MFIIPPLANPRASYVQDNPCNKAQIKALLIRYASQELNVLAARIPGLKALVQAAGGTRALS